MDHNFYHLYGNPFNNWQRNLETHSEFLLTELKFASAQHAQQALQKLATAGKIWFAEPNHTSSLMNQSESTISTRYVAASELLYHINMINLNQALTHLETQTNFPHTRPIIAIMDSGVDINHPALKHQVIDLHQLSWPQARACPGDQYGCNTAAQPSRNQLGNGDIYPIGTSGFNEPCQTTLLGHNTASNYRDALLKTQYCQHGTLVAGLAAGYSDLVYGACPYCQIIPIKIVDDKLRISDSSIIRALEYISLIQLKDGRRVKIVNVSLGKASKSLSVAMMIRRLAENNQILFVGAAGNDNTTVREYPGSLKDVMAISALNSNTKKIVQSNYGGWVSLAAPGHYLLSSIPGGDVKYDHGTSMATPLVAGVAGLVLAASTTDIHSYKLRRILENSADTNTLYTKNPLFKLQQTSHKTTLKPGSLGWGVVDAWSALRTHQTSTSSSTLASTAATPSTNSAQPPHPESRIGGCAVIGTTPTSSLAQAELHLAQHHTHNFPFLKLLLGWLGLPIIFPFLRALRYRIRGHT